MAGKKFQFSLQSILKLRKHESDTARQTLAQAMEARRAQEARLDALEERLREAARQSLQAGPADPLMFRRLAAYRMELQQARDRESRTLEQKKYEEARARDALLMKQRAEASLQTLHDEEKARHQRKAQQAETAFLDEQALISHLRKQSASQK